MKITVPEYPDNITSSLLKKRISNLQNLLQELNELELDKALVVKINEELKKLNLREGTEKVRIKQLAARQRIILQILEKEAKLVCANHYRNQWLAIGMSVFGIPMGVVFGLILKNMAFIGIGLPLGMTIGIAVGTQMDEKAKKEGRQLKVELQ